MGKSENDLKVEAVIGFILWILAISFVFGAGYFVGGATHYIPLYQDDTVKTINENSIVLKKSGATVYCTPPDTLHIGDTLNLID